MVRARRSIGLFAVAALVLGAAAAWADDSGGSLVTINAKDAPLSEVTALISDMAGVTIVAHKDVQNERISISLKEMPVQAALQAIAEAYDLVLKYLPETRIYIIRRGEAKADSGRVVRVGAGPTPNATTVEQRPTVVMPPPVAPTAPSTSAQKVPTQPASVPAHGGSGQYDPSAPAAGRKLAKERIFTHYIRASEVAAMYGCPAWDVSPTGQRIDYQPQLDAPRVSVPLGDTINRTDAYIKQARKKRWQIDPRQAVNNGVYVRDQFGEQPGGAGGPGGGGAGGRPGAGGGAGGRGGGRGGGGGQAVFTLPDGIKELVGYDLISALIVVGEPDAIQELRELIELLDVPPQQIEVEARFVTLSVNDADSLGMTWSVTNGTASASGSTLGQGGASFAFQYATGNFQALLTTIVRNNKGKVVNAPKVATQNGQPAIVAFDQTIPVTISDTVITQASQTVSTTIDTIDVTTELVVVPRVTGQPPDESITTIIVPQVADIIGYVDNPSGGTIPIVATQQIQTMLRVPNGQTIALGGLVRKNNSESSTRIPLLGDLPFIGGLFRSRTRTTDESELLIFLTPTILRELKIGSGPSAVR